MRAELADLRTELRTEIADVRLEISQLRVDMADRFQRQTVWTLGAIATSTAILGSLTALL